MAASVLGEAADLSDMFVHRENIDRLRSVIDADREVFTFECSLCGEVREARIIDPGVLVCQEFTCRRNWMECKVPPSPPNARRVTFFRPGSLVWALNSQEQNRLWPGIIEDPPEGSERYYIDHKKVLSPKAYWVTFIYPKDQDSKWLGGFIPRKRVFPYLHPMLDVKFVALDLKTEREKEIFRKSTELVTEAINAELRERLAKFSYVAHVASLKNIPITDRYRNEPWALIRRKRSASQAQLDRPGPSSAPQFARGAHGFSQPEREDPVDYLPSRKNEPPRELGPKSTRPRKPLGIKHVRQERIRELLIRYCEADTSESDPDEDETPKRRRLN